MSAEFKRAPSVYENLRRLRSDVCLPKNYSRPKDDCRHRRASREDESEQRDDPKTGQDA